MMGIFPSLTNEIFCIEKGLSKIENWDPWKCDYNYVTLHLPDTAPKLSSRILSSPKILFASLELKHFMNFWIQQQAVKIDGRDKFSAAVLLGEIS